MHGDEALQGGGVYVRAIPFARALFLDVDESDDEEEFDPGESLADLYRKPR